MEKRHGIDHLLAHADWLPALAARLVGDSDADDLAQETWMAAMSAPSPTAGGRGWLTAVARNLSRKRWRTTSARRRREQAVVAEASATASSPEDLLLKAQLQRTLADLVVALEEPYRGTVVMRYFEGKSAAQIARALGVPAGTVRWRLKEGIDRLRVQLDAIYDGDRRRWQAMVAALALPAVSAVSGGGGATMMMATTKAKLLGGGLAVTVLGAVALLLHFGAGGDPQKERRGIALARLASEPLTAQVRLREGGRAAGGIFGVVKAPDGAPVAGALVALSRARVPGEPGSRFPRARAVTDGAGRFAFEDAWAGSYQLTASARGHRAVASPVIVLAAGRREEVQLLLGTGGHTVSGQVLDEGGGPIPGAVVAAGLGFPWTAREGAPVPQRQFVAIADGEGRYQLTLERREYTLNAEAGGYVPAQLSVAVTRDVTRDLEMEPAARVAGRVVERVSGQPVADAEIVAAEGGRWSLGFRAIRTDAEGRFLIEDLPSGSFELTARHRDRNLFGTGTVTAVATQAVEGVEISMGPGVRLQGRVRDESGAGLPGVAVAVNSTDVGLVEQARAVSEQDGRFQVTLLGPGRYMLAAFGADPSEPRGDVRVAVGPQGLDGAELVLSRPPVAAAVKGRVVDGAGQPTGGVLVRAELVSTPAGNYLGATESLADGTFHLDRLPAKPLRVMAWHPTAGITEATVDPAAASPSLELRLGKGATIAGTVKYEDGAPVPGASVAVTRMEGMVVYDSVTTADDGSFALRSLSPGRYSVKASRKQGPHNLWTSTEEPWLKLVDVDVDQQRTDLALVLGRGGRTITGRALLADGSPAIGARVVANRQEKGSAWKPEGAFVETRSTTDQEGRFTLSDVEDVTFALWASLPGHPDAEMRDVSAGRRDVALTFPAPARISGTVVSADGKPLSAFLISAVPAKVAGESLAQRERRAEAERRPPRRVQHPEGAFVLDGLVGGPYEVKVATADSSGGARQSITVAPGEDKAGVRLVAAAGVKATGKVVALESGAPLANLMIWWRTGGRNLETKTAADGSFNVEGLVPGEPVNVEVQMAQLTDRVSEHLSTVVPAGVASFDLGTFRLMKGDWRATERHGSTVGLRIEMKEGRALVSNVAENSPAASSGIKPGEVVLAVNGREVAGLGAGAIRHLMRQPVGSKLALKLQAPGGQPHDVVLTAVKR